MRFSKWQFQVFRLDNHRLIHSLKTAVAFLIGLFISYTFHFPLKGAWILISILVVMCAQSRVGAILQKSYMRFLGTIIGAIVAGLTLWLVYPNIVYTTLILCLAIALFSYISASQGALSEAGPLGAVTVVIILISENPNFSTVLSRFLEINLGIVIALFVSRFIWPLHSLTQLRYILINTLEDFKMLTEQLKESALTSTEKSHDFFEDRIMDYMATQKKLFVEVMRESFGRSELGQIFTAILHSEREVLCCITLMRHALINLSDKDSLTFNQQPHMQELYQTIQTIFQVTIDKLKGKKVEQDQKTLIKFSESQQIKNELEALETNSSLQFSVNLFIFTVDYFLTQLDKMTNLLKKV